MRADVIALVMSLLWFVMALASFAVGVLLIGLFFGWPLMWPTISTEGTDSFDALSRSYSYTFQRPLFYFLYVIAAGVLGLLASFIVFMLAAITQHLGYWAISWGAGRERAGELFAAMIDPSTVDGSLHSAAMVLRFWSGCISLLAISFVYCYFWTAITKIYFLLRLKVDGTEMDEIAHDEAAEAEETYGLPPLATDEGGVPRVVDPSPPSQPT